jgi:hypothetical protein
MVMSKRIEVSAERLKLEMLGAFEETMKQVMAALNAAPEGNIIRGSEHQVKHLMDEFKRRTFEAATQLAADSNESAFPPSGGGADG